MTPEKIRQNLEALVQEGEHLDARARGRESSETYTDRMTWGINVVALIESIFGTKGPHYAMAKSSLDGAYGPATATLLGASRAALKAWDAGYVFEMRQLAEAAVEASLIDQAEELLEKGYHQGAAVLAGAVLEQHLRSLCPTYGVSLLAPNGRPKTMEPVNVELRAAGAYDALQQKQLTFLIGIRNNAAHGAGVTVDDARTLVRDVISLCVKLR
jgi:hypothetical protein